MIRDFKNVALAWPGGRSTTYTLAILVNVPFPLWASGVAMHLQSVQAVPIMQTPVFLVLFFAPLLNLRHAEAAG